MSPQRTRILFRKALVRFAQVILLTILFLPLGLMAKDPWCLQWALDSIRKVSPGKTIKFLVKNTLGKWMEITSQPVLGPIQFIDLSISQIRQSGFKSAYRVPFQFLNANKIAIGGYVTLYVAADHSLNFTIEFRDQTDDLFFKHPDKPLVVVNAVNDGSPVESSINYHPRYQDVPNVHRITVNSAEELKRKVSQIAQEHGSIGAIDILAHGLPGRFFINSQAMGTEQIAKNLDFPTGIFAPDALVRLQSCFSGNGEIGEEMSKTIGESFLKLGGTVLNSRVALSGGGFFTVPEMREDYPILAEVERLLAKPYLAGGALVNSRISEEGFLVWDPVRITQIPPNN